MDAATALVRRIGLCIDDVGLEPGITEAAAVPGVMGRVSAVSGITCGGGPGVRGPATVTS